MAMGSRSGYQEGLWIPTCALARPEGHPFYERLNDLLAGHEFDRFVEGKCRRFYAPKMGQPGLAPGIYFRLLLIGYFEGIGSERGIAWRAGVGTKHCLSAVYMDNLATNGSPADRRRNALIAK